MVSEAAKVLGVGKICHKEPWGLALVAGELTGSGSVDQAGEIVSGFPRRGLCIEPKRFVLKRKVGDDSRCWYCTYAGF